MVKKKNFVMLLLIGLVGLSGVHACSAATGFEPRAPYGSFGGSSCQPSGKVPIIFIHGNGDHAANWSAPSSDGGPSVLDRFRAEGYSDCDLFGVTYLSETERANPKAVIHTVERQKIIAEFIEDVLKFTNAPAVDIIAHSLGVTMTLQALSSHEAWPKVRKFVAIAGAMRGIQVCLFAGPLNQAAMTCASQNPIIDGRFGFYPNENLNPKMGTAEGSFSRMPKEAPQTQFYSIRAGLHDQVICSMPRASARSCVRSPLFFDEPNVISQLNVGAGSLAPEEADPTKDPLRTGGDADGIGHMRAKTDTGALQLKMIIGTCSGVDCCKGYKGKCRK